jgi:hypothetical protein
MNLSVAGMFVHAAGSCALGSDVVCDMPLPSGMCQVKGRVTRVQRMPDATGMAIQFIDLPAQQEEMLNQLVERSREPSIPLAVRFEGMQAPIQCRGVFFDDKLRLRTKVPFLRIGSNVQVSVDGNSADLSATADLTGTVSGVALRPSPLDGVPRLAIDLDLLRAETDDADQLGPTPLEKAIADCVAVTRDRSLTPTPTPVPQARARDEVSNDNRQSSSFSVSGELRPRSRTRTEEVAATAEALATASLQTAAPATRPAADWDETQAIPVEDRRRPITDRRVAERASHRSTRRPPPGSNALMLVLIGAAGLGLGILAVTLAGPVARKAAHPVAGTPPTMMPMVTPAAPAATPRPAPEVVMVPAPPAATAAPRAAATTAVSPSPAAPSPTAVKTPVAARNPAPARRVVPRPRPAAPLAFDAGTRQYKLTGVTSLDLGGAKLTGVTGLAGVAGANVRGINVGVTADASLLRISFPTPETDAAYGVQVSPSWPTMSAISDKTAEGFTITFGTPAPASATIDWLLVH